MIVAGHLFVSQENQEFWGVVEHKFVRLPAPSDLWRAFDRALREAGAMRHDLAATGGVVRDLTEAVATIEQDQRALLLSDPAERKRWCDRMMWYLPEVDAIGGTPSIRATFSRVDEQKLKQYLPLVERTGYAAEQLMYGATLNIGSGPRYRCYLQGLSRRMLHEYDYGPDCLLDDVRERYRRLCIDAALEMREREASIPSLNGERWLSARLMEFVCAEVATFKGGSVPLFFEWSQSAGGPAAMRVVS